ARRDVDARLRGAPAGVGGGNSVRVFAGEPAADRDRAGGLVAVRGGWNRLHGYLAALLYWRAGADECLPQCDSGEDGALNQLGYSRGVPAGDTGPADRGRVGSGVYWGGRVGDGRGIDGRDVGRGGLAESRCGPGLGGGDGTAAAVGDSLRGAADDGLAPAW